MTVASKTVRCCVKCDECSDCYTFSLYELRDIMLAIDLAVAEFAEAYTSIINWGFPSKDQAKCITESTVKKLLTYKSSIRRFYDNMRQKAMACLCNAELQGIKEKVSALIDLSRCKTEQVTDIRYDYSEYDKWVAVNPTCVAYDTWERSMIKCNTTFVISVSKIEQPIRTLYAIVKKDKDNCVMKLLAYASQAKCNRIVSPSVNSREKCKAEISALVKKHKCDLSISLYTKLLSCNMSFNLISTILGCGGKFLVDGDGNPSIKVGSKVSRVTDLVTLAGGTWPNVELSEYEELYQ